MTEVVYITAAEISKRVIAALVSGHAAASIIVQIPVNSKAKRYYLTIGGNYTVEFAARRGPLPGAPRGIPA